MSTAQSKFIEINGINMHYLEWGEIGAPDILLVHGWTGLGASWASVAASLENNYHIIAPDNRGHGKSSKPVTGYRLRDFTEDIHQLIDSLSLQQPALVGHSWGGAIGITMAADHPYDISKAFLEDPVCWKLINAFVTSLPQALARHDRLESEIRAEARQRGLKPMEVDEEVYRHHHFSIDAITRLLTDNRDWAFVCEEYMKRIASPTMILVADINAGGYILPEELNYYQQIASAQTQFRLWEGVGHGMHAAEPERFNQELADFLA